MPALVLGASLLSGVVVPGCGAPDDGLDDEAEYTSTAQQALVAGSNLALGKAATQSSAYPWGGGAPGLAVDGNTSGAWADGSVTHTAPEPSPWWEVDLGAVSPIGTVELSNRTDCCSDRLSDFQLLVSDDHATWQAWDHPGTAGAQVSFAVNRGARYVKVQLDATGAPDRILSLAEVRVLSSSNLALGKTATQSSAYQWGGGGPGLAVDGDTGGVYGDGSVTHTDPEPSPWWQLDLGAVHPVGAVELYNRTDCCSDRLSDFHLLLSNDGASWQAWDHPGTAGAQVSFAVNRPARYVKVQLDDNGAPDRILSLAEVRVTEAAPGASLPGPAQPTAPVGATEGKLEVDALGAATYTIPLQVPPGTRGVEPRLALAYRSAGGNGLVGVGWTLSGISMITRCARTLAQDGYTGGAEGLASDAFCLDGQRLVPVSGANGMDGTEYRTERETFSRVVSHGSLAGGPSWFEVTDKSGNTAVLGGAPDARPSIGFLWPFPRLWALSRLTDRNGNYLTVSYTSDNKQLYPAQILYTMNDAEPSLRKRRVEFTYEARPDVERSYLRGYRSLTAKRLSRVKTFVEGGGGEVQAREYRLSYGTSAATRRSLLTSVAECDGQGVCLPATQLEYDDDGPGAAGAATMFDVVKPSGWIYQDSLRYDPGAVLVPGDYDGDGRTDFLRQERGGWDDDDAATIQAYLSNGDGTFTVVAPSCVTAGYDMCQSPLRYDPGSFLHPGDYDGDGRTDFLRQEHGDWDDDPYVSFQAYLSTGGGQFTPAPFQAGYDFQDRLRYDPGALLHFGDYDGDGRTDFLSQDHGGWDDGNGGDVQLYTATGQGQFGVHHPTQTEFSWTMPYDAFTGTGLTGAYLYPADVNGDGRTDFFRQEHGDWAEDGANNLQVFLSQGNGEFTVVTPHDILPDGYDRIQEGLRFDAGAYLIPGDYNGDGKADFVRLEHGDWVDGNADFEVFFSRGDGSFDAVTPADPQLQSLMNGDHVTLTPADFNGDGKMDLLRRGDQDWHPEIPLSVWLSNGDGTFEKLIPPDPTAQQSAYSNSYLDRVNIFPADVDGDGKSDLLWQDKEQADDDVYDNFRVYLFRGADAVDALTHVTTGLGATAAIQYAALTDASVHAPGGPAPGTLVDARRPIHVVKSYQESNNPSDTVDHELAYAGGRFDRAGRGFVGFESVTDTNLTLGSVTTTEYNSWPFPQMGTIRSRTVSDLDGAAQVRTEYEYAASETHPGVHVVVPVQEEVTHTEAGQGYTTVRQFEYDASGNITIVRDLRLGGDPSDNLETCTTYSGDAALWRLDYPTSTRVGTGCAVVSGACQCSTVLRSIERSYDPATMNLVSVSEADLRYGGWPHVDFTYDALGNVVTRTTPGEAAPIVETTAWDPDYRSFPVAVTRAAGALSQTTLAAYDPRTGAAVARTDDNGTTTAFALDGLGRMVERSETSPAGVLTPIVRVILGVDADGPYRETQTRDDWIADDWRWEREYLDGRGRVRRTVSPGADPQNPILVEREYDAAGEVRWETLPHFQDPTPLSMQVLTQEHERDFLGRLTRSTDGTGVVTEIAYAVDTSACALCTMKVTATEAQGTPDARVWIRHEDALGNPRRQVDPEGRVTTFGYDRLARRTEVADAAGATVTAYDSLDRVWTVTSPDRGATVHEYGASTWLSQTTDANGQVTTYAYDALGRVRQRHTAGVETVNFTYDDPASAGGRGRLTGAEVVPEGQEAPSSSSALSYTPSGDVAVNVVTIDGHTYTLSSDHDPMRRLRALTYPDGAVVSRSYDAQGQIAQIAGGGTVYAQYGSYNPAGQPGTAAYGNGTLTLFEYDDAQRLLGLETKAPNGHKLFSYDYQWDRLRRVTAIVDYTKQNTQTFTYSAAGHLVEAMGEAYGTLAYAYDAAGNMTTKAGAAHAYTGHRVTSGPGFSATYDAAGNRTGVVRGGDAWQYEYGAQNRLAQVKKNGAVVGQFAYDFTGERVKKVDADGTVTLYATPAFEVTFLPDGRRLETKYVHGPAGRIAAITVEHPAGAGAMLDWRGLDSASARFDRRSLAGLLGLALHEARVWRAHPRAPLAGEIALGLALAAAALWLVRRRAPGRFAAAAGALRGVVLPRRTAYMRRHPVFAWAAPFVMAAFLAGCGRVPGADLAGQAQGALVPGPNGEGHPAAGTYYFHQNHLGSSSLVTDAGGAQVARAEYTPYGEIVQAASPGQDIFRAKFAGKEWDGDSGLYYFNARYYDPLTGRFITADPHVLGGPERDAASANPYAYANDSPIVYTDPSGHFFWVPIIVMAVVGAYAGAAATNGGTWNPASWSWTSWRTWVGLGVGGLVGGLGAAVGAGVGGFAGAMLATTMNALAINGLRFLSPEGSSGKDFAIGLSVDLTVGLVTAGVMSKIGGGDKLGSAFRERLANKMAEKLAGPALAKAVAMTLGKASLRAGGVVGRQTARDYRESMNQLSPAPRPPPPESRVDASPAIDLVSHLSDALLAAAGADALPGRTARDIGARQGRPERTAAEAMISP